MDRVNSKIRDIMVHECYIPAGANVRESEACDFLYKDIKKLLWSELDFDEMVEFNHERYTFVHARMDEDLFDHLIAEFKHIKAVLGELMEQMDSHKEVLLARMQRYIDNRTKSMMKFSDLYGHTMPKVKNYDFHVIQKIYNPNAKRLFLKIPGVVRMDGTTHMFEERPSVDELLKEPVHPDVGIIRGSNPNPQPYVYKPKKSALKESHDELVVKTHIEKIEKKGEDKIIEDAEKVEPVTFGSLTGYQLDESAITDPRLKDNERAFHHQQNYFKPNENGDYNHLLHIDQTHLKKRKLRGHGMVMKKKFYRGGKKAVVKRDMARQGKSRLRKTYAHHWDIKHRLGSSNQLV